MVRVVYEIKLDDVIDYDIYDGDSNDDDIYDDDSNDDAINLSTFEFVGLIITVLYISFGLIQFQAH